jgi:hypothetical protein
MTKYRAVRRVSYVAGPKESPSWHNFEPGEVVVGPKTILQEWLAIGAIEEVTSG